MKIICIKGGLGNQLFEYCRYQILTDEKSNRSVRLFYDWRRLKDHGGVQLAECFDITLPPQHLSTMLVVGILKTCRALGILRKWHNDEDERSILIDDYSQDKRFIGNALQWFRFRDSVINLATDWKKQIDDERHPVAVHYRRGDYLHPKNINNFGLCPQEYYDKAMTHVMTQHPEAHFFIFSDDIEWVRNNIPTENTTVVNLHPNTPDYVSMYLMSCCRSHIIANSTFSFWGATLSKKRGIRICPKQWFAAKDWTTPDIFDNDWIKM